MLCLAGPKAAGLAALMAARDPLRGATVDLAQRLAALDDPARFAASADRGALQQIAAEARRLARLAPQTRAAWRM